MPISTLLVANRGEIAVRILRSAQQMGLRTVLAVSEVDQDSMAAELADAVAVVGPAPAQKSYLNAEALVAAALEHGCDAVHPGYGFLSENAAFARRVQDIERTGDLSRRLADGSTEVREANGRFADLKFEMETALVGGAAYDAAGGFDQSIAHRWGWRIDRRSRGDGFGEDTMLAWRVIHNGGKMTYCPEALVRHAVERQPAPRA